MSQYPAPPAPGFPPPPAAGFGAPPPAGRTNGMAVASLICGLLGCLGITPLLGIIFGILGLGNAKKSGGNGRGMSIAGIILSVVWIGGIVLFFGSIAALFGMTKVQRELAATFAKDVAAGNVDAAMANATPSVTREEVQAAADKLKPLGTVTDTTMFGVSGQATAAGKFWMIAGAVTFNQGTGVGYAAKVVDQGGSPKVDGFLFNVNGQTVSGGNPPDQSAATKP